MRHFLAQTNLSIIFLFLLVTSPVINAQVDSTEVQKEKEVQNNNVAPNNSDCPTKIEDWDNYLISQSNNQKLIDCNNWLKTVYMEGKELTYMEQKEMKRVLLDRYKKIIAYFNEPGKDEGMAEELQEELEVLQNRKPAKSN